MKRFFDFNLLLSGLLMAAFTFTFTACSDDNDDDDGGDLTVPTYAEDAVKFEIEDANSPYASIELTANGEYIIEEKSSAYNPYSASKHIKALTKAKENATSDKTSGTYTKNADGSYDLKNFGKIVITDNNITITPSNGQAITYTGTKANKISGMASSIFRTWKASEYKLMVRSSEGNIDKTFKSFEDMVNWVEGNEGSDEVDPNEIWYRPTFERIIISPYSTFAISAKKYKGNSFITNIYVPFKWTSTGAQSGKVSIVDNEIPMTFELKSNSLVVTYDESDEEETVKIIITCNPA